MLPTSIYKVSNPAQLASQQHSMDSSSYQLPNIFPEGTVHHAAELGSKQAIQAVEQSQKALRGLPATVVLEQRDELLHWVPLHVAAERGHLEVVKYIISHDVDLDAADGHQVRPLHLAAINNHTAVVKALVDKGANVTKQDTDGDLPTHWAATKGHVEMLEMLLDRGAPLDAHNKAGYTAMHRAALNGRVDACRLLLRRGASIHAVTKTGCTALHLAASNNHLGVMELLLQLGASTHMKDQQGATAYEMCIGDAARSLLQEKETALQEAGHSSRTQPRSRPESSVPQAPEQPADISSVPYMPRFKKAANTNLDADGFPTAEAQLASAAGGLQQEASDLDQGGFGEAQMLLLEQQAEAPFEDDLAASVFNAPQASYSIAASTSFTSRPGEVSRQSSKQAPSASASFKQGSGAGAGGKPQLQPTTWLSGKAKQAAANQRFLKQYSLNKKGLFAP